MNIRITLSSIMMATICSGLLTGLLYWIRKRSGWIQGYGIYGIVLLYLFCIVRIILPIDFSFTYGISVRGMFSNLYDLLWFDKYSIGQYELSILEILFLVWLAVALVKLIRFGVNHWRTGRMLDLLDEREDIQCRAVLQRVFETTGRKRQVRVLYHQGITMPVSMGIRKWKIILPAQTYTDEDLYHILMHEYTHLLNGDLKVKMLTCMFVCIFWWNPVVYLLEKDLECSLEMKCDLCVTEKLPREEVAGYLQTIVKAIRSRGNQKNSYPMNEAVSLGDNGKSEILQRFEFVRNSQRGRSNLWSMALVTAVFIFVWTASYSMILLPFYEPPIEDIIKKGGDYELSSDRSYIVHKNGNYFLHMIRDNGEEKVEQISEESKDIYEIGGFEIKEE